jgi:hypothetical protein
MSLSLPVVLTFVKNKLKAYYTKIQIDSLLKRTKQSCIVDFTLPAHSFTVGNWVIQTSSGLEKGIATAPETSDVIGVIVATTLDTISVCTSGYIQELTGLIPGSVYFLSDVTPGEMIINGPTDLDHVSKPVFLAVSTTSGVILNQRGIVLTNTDLDLGIKIAKDGTEFTDTVKVLNFEKMLCTETDPGKFTLSVDDSPLDKKEDKINKNVANGYLGLDTDAKVPPDYLSKLLNDLDTTGSTNRAWSSSYTLSRINSPSLKNYKEVLVNLGNISGNVTLDLTQGNVFVATLTGNVVLNLSGATSGYAHSCTFILTNDSVANRTLNFSSTVKYQKGIVPSRTLTANATDIWTFYTWSAGATWLASISILDLK